LPEAVAARPPFADLASFAPSPIVNLHLWLDRAVAPFEFAAFTGSELQWIFNRTRVDAGHTRENGGRGGAEHLVISLSAAGAFAGLTKKELQERFLPQVERALPHARGARLLRC